MFEQTSERKELERQMQREGRLPPGQSLTLKWPVLHYGSVPVFDAQTWDFRIAGLVERPLRLSWEEFKHLPQQEVVADMHCVTRWSRFDNRWAGVPFRKLMDLVRPAPGAKYALVHGEQDYTANVPLVDLMKPDTLFAFEHDGQPLSPEHGYPVRLVVPHLYGWKSVKWVRGLDLLERDQAGFWEQNGYHMYGDPWKQQRFDTD